MKKIMLLAGAVLAAVSLASCDSKMCYCYDNGHEEVLYVNPDLSAAPTVRVAADAWRPTNA